MEDSENNRTAVEKILGEALPKVPNIDLWTQYLDYLRRVHPLHPDPDGSKRGVISQAFDTVLTHVGLDPDSGTVWREYIDFIKGGPGSIGGTAWQDKQKEDLLRAAYQRAVKLPHAELTRLWKEYDLFEVAVNKATGRKYLQEQSPHYMQARSARMQLEQKLGGLDRDSLPKLPPLRGCAGDQEFGRQVGLWRGWIKWEKEDPLVFLEEDVSQYRRRVLYVLRQATMSLRFYPEIWFEAAEWCFAQAEAGGPAEPVMLDAGEEFLDQGITANPESVLLALKKADRVQTLELETGNTDEVAVRNGVKLDPVFEKVLAALYALHKKGLERLQKGIAEIELRYAAMTPDEEDEAEEGARKESSDDEEERAQQQKPKTRAQRKQDEIAGLRTATTYHQDQLKSTISYIWVAKLRCFRRIQGQGLPGKPKKGFRGVFAEARPRGQLTSEVYIANALMEWGCYRDASAQKIFERGLKLFPVDEVFALEYIKHLVSTNDYTNARAVFETTMTKITNTTDKKTGAAALSIEEQRRKCRPLLGYMHTLESQYGDLDKIHKLERRMKELYPDEPDVVRFGNRFALPSFDAMEVQVIISPSQTRPPTQQQPMQQALQSTEQMSPLPTGRDLLRLGPNGPYIGSPKRGLDDSDPEAPQRKFMRGESPLKGAAGRRMQNHSTSSTIAAPAVGASGGFMTKNFVPQPTGPPPLPPGIMYVLSQIPAARHYNATQFIPERLVEYLRGVDLGRAFFRDAKGNIIPVAGPT